MVPLLLGHLFFTHTNTNCWPERCAHQARRSNALPRSHRLTPPIPCRHLQNRPSASRVFGVRRSTFNVRVVAAPYNRCLQSHRPVVPFLSFLATPANCGHISRHRRKFLEESRFHRTLSTWILPRSAGASRSWRRLRVWPKKAHHTD